ncbi:MAG TPA: hypothetical protein VK148_19445, partial [Xanthobacteraceae bacterium]|nr:hypothetical protein [Xanthobacteraceae bacterium]
QAVVSLVGFVEHFWSLSARRMEVVYIGIRSKEAVGRNSHDASFLRHGYCAARHQALGAIRHGATLSRARALVRRSAMAIAPFHNAWRANFTNVAISRRVL